MPLVYQQHINLVTKLAVWHIAEDEHFFLSRVCINDGIRHPHKRLQHLAGRYLLNELYEDFPLKLIQIADTLKPYLPSEMYHFSISHCGDYAAVIVSKENRVGVDIETVSPKIIRIQEKFLSPNELNLLLNPEGFCNESGNDNLLLTLGWGIKETLFKWNGETGIDFREHLQINTIRFHDNQFLAECHVLKHEAKKINVTGISFNHNILTWTVT